jgi:hypothetical protein
MSAKAQHMCGRQNSRMISQLTSALRPRLVRFWATALGPRRLALDPWCYCVNLALAGAEAVLLRHFSTS